jgi:hypothetical protein
MLSDKRVHENPGVVGFDPVTGSAPQWYDISATGGLCVDDINFTMTITNSAYPTCYELTVKTNTTTMSGTADSLGKVTLTSNGMTAYTDPSTVYFEISKTCDVTVTEAADWSVTWHL